MLIRSLHHVITAFRVDLLSDLYGTVPSSDHVIIITSHLCPRFAAGDLLKTYFVQISFWYEQICPSYHHCKMGKKLSISISATDALVYYNCWVQEDINASSLNYSLRCNNEHLLSAGRHACTCTCDCFVATWASGVHSSMHACMCTLSLASTKPLITAAIQMRFG